MLTRYSVYYKSSKVRSVKCVPWNAARCGYLESWETLIVGYMYNDESHNSQRVRKIGMSLCS